jgi:hypothetical protein
MYMLLNPEAPGSILLLDSGRLFWSLTCESVVAYWRNKILVIPRRIRTTDIWKCLHLWCSKNHKIIQHSENSPTPRSFHWLCIYYIIAETEEGPVFFPNKSIFQLGYTVSCWVHCSETPLILCVQFWRKLTSVLGQPNVIILFFNTAKGKF